MEKIVNTVTNCYGEEIPSAVLYQEGGMLYLWEIACLSSSAHNLGNCNCINHPPTVENPISTNEVVRQFGSDVLEGFEEPGVEQLVFDEFGIEIDELETYLKVSYRLGSNPLPFLRKKTTHPVIFLDGSVNLEAFEGEKVIFIVNSRGEISVEATQN